MTTATKKPASNVQLTNGYNGNRLIARLRAGLLGHPDLLEKINQCEATIVLSSNCYRNKRAVC